MANLEEHKKAFYEIIERGAKFRDLCNYLASAVNNPVSVLIAHNTMLSKSDDYNKELIDEYIYTEENYDYEDKISTKQKIEEVYRSHKAKLLYLPYLHNKRVLCGCTYLGNRIGMIEVAIINDPLSDEQMELIEYAASAFHIFFRLNNFVIREGKGIAMRNILVGVLDGTIDLDYQRKHLYNFRAFDVDSWRLVWVTPRDKYKCNDTEFMNELQSRVEGNCEEIKNCWCVPYSFMDIKGMVVLYDESSKKTIDMLKELCAEKDLYAIISRAIHTLSEISRAFEDACYMDMMFHNNKNITPEPGIRFYENYKIGIAINEVFYNIDKNLLDSPLLEEIYAYDNIHNTDYFLTLECYFDNDGNLDRIAEILNVHKNTVAYRLKKISELFDINFKSFRENADLYYIMKFTRQKRRLEHTYRWNRRTED